MAKRSLNEYAIALYEATKDIKGAALEQTLKQFVQLLYKEQKLKQAGKIIAEFERYAKKQEGVVSIEITAARKLDAKTIEQIKQVFGEKVESTEKVDESIIGGIVVREENKIFDASLKTQLNKLKQKLT